MKIERFVVSHRSGCGMCSPECFTRYEDADAYVKSELANFVQMYMQEKYNLNIEEDEDDSYLDEIVKDYNEIKNNGNEAIVEFGVDNDLIIGTSFAAWSDWEEFAISPITIQLTDDEIKSLKGE